MSVPAERVVDLLRGGDIEILGLMPRASNYTFAVRLTGAGMETLAVYKPMEGETPLWDFPDETLWKREIAAYELSEALGWALVPPTIERDGPHGIGSLQLFIEAEPAEHYFTLYERFPDRFRQLAAFDVLINNADRKSGHCLLERGTGHIWVVDHGVCFHEEPKLRTVVWDLAGDALAQDDLRALEQLRARLDAGDDPAPRLRWLLSDPEMDALRARLDELVHRAVLPEPDETRRWYPWPPI